MKIPLAYNLRNLAVRKATTLMTALGIALTVAVLLTTMAMVEGLNSLLRSSGNPLHVLVMRKGSSDELSSNLNRQVFQDLKFKSGIARGKGGDPLASLEMVIVVNLPSVDNPDGSNVTFRGVSPAGLEMRDHIRLASGRWFQPGRAELVVGKYIASRFPDARLGKKIRLARADWEVVGVMDAANSAANSEVFADVNQLSADNNRTEVLSSALIRAADEAAAPALIRDLEADRRLNVTALTEKEYYELQMRSGDLFRYLGLFVSLIMAVGSAFAAMNTMYAAVARRTREIGALRVLGFSRASILTSFLIESLLLASLGGLLGVLLVLPLNGFSTGISTITFSEVAFHFRVTPPVMAAGILFALVMGTMGGLLPAGNAARKQILTALRDI
ncbi:MAG: ABC transporter permease [Acidobacteria bacterium]|nr:ABC transporter permease [Acidobacteriota bacterium]